MARQFVQTDDLVTADAFLILFFLMYVAVSILNCVRQPPNLKGYVSGSLVFGLPVVAFTLHATMISRIEYGLAWSAFALGAFYLLLGWTLFVTRRETFRLLVEAFAALGVIFASLAIPLAFDTRTTAAMWAVEGAGLLWLGVRQERRLPRLFGMLLQAGAGVGYLIGYDELRSTQAILNSAYHGRDDARGVRRVQRLLAVPQRAASRAVRGRARRRAHLLGSHRGGSSAARTRSTATSPHRRSARCWSTRASPRRSSRGWASAGSGRWRAGSHCSCRQSSALTHSLMRSSWAIRSRNGARSAGSRSSLRTSRCCGSRSRSDIPRLEWLHGGACWALALLFAWELNWQVAERTTGVWASLAWGFAPALLLAWLGRRQLRPRLADRATSHRLSHVLAPRPSPLRCASGSSSINLSSTGDPAWLPYLPLLNPLDVCVALALAALAMWWSALDATQRASLWQFDVRALIAIAAGIVFLWLNAALIRTLHHNWGAPITAYGIAHSTFVQSALSIFWGVLGFAAMTVAAKQRWRYVWMVGMGLMVVVVVKLFPVDLSSIGTVARIASFITVGLLLVITGYFAPLPPKREAA